VKFFFGYTLFNFSDFDWEIYYGVGSTHSPGFVLVLLLPIGKVGWKLFTLSVFCLRIGQNLKDIVEERGMISKWELVKICYLVSCVGLFYVCSSLELLNARRSHHR